MMKVKRLESAMKTDSASLQVVEQLADVHQDQI
jgi:hypothetical protein